MAASANIRLLVVVLVIRALLFGVYIRAPDLGKLPCRIRLNCSYLFCLMKYIALHHGV